MSLGQLAPQRVDMNRQLAELGEVLQAKEDLAARMHANGEHLEVEMKQTRVRLMRQLKEESERHRRAQGERDREVRALRLREQQRAVQAARQERQSGLKMTVLRRRMEEALAAKSRLEAALQKRQVAAGKTSTPGDMAARVKPRCTRCAKHSKSR
ncbi:hypothetical protein IscW_ISCW005100 [Ixodes scapularis]|uniref:Uncharacterized protein n=1 Tax=Ixodes scapularis TaxID=6945 RepID=B7PK81_IXOSC|nr:hypothetical protein IscW_ISCW005100 [Ixodes scapularis]|eukprot:XP_002409625.1 hypothetical protein IscW_ISCW005100 [Ixodes scapularis]